MTPSVSLHSQETGLLARKTLLDWVSTNISFPLRGGNIWPEKENIKSSDTPPSGNALLYFLADCDKR